MFEDKTEGDTEEEPTPIIQLAPAGLSEAFQRYVEAGVIKKVQFDQEKLLMFHEDESSHPSKCGEAIMSVWEAHGKMLAAKKEAAKESKKRKRETKSPKAMTSPGSTRSSERLSNKKGTICGMPIGKFMTRLTSIQVSGKK